MISCSGRCKLNSSATRTGNSKAMSSRRFTRKRSSSFCGRRRKEEREEQTWAVSSSFNEHFISGGSAVPRGFCARGNSCLANWAEALRRWRLSQLTHFTFSQRTRKGRVTIAGLRVQQNTKGFSLIQETSRRDVCSLKAVSDSSRFLGTPDSSLISVRHPAETTDMFSLLKVILLCEI